MIDFTLKVDSLGDEEDVSALQGFDTMAESLQLVLMPDRYSSLRARMREPAGSTEQRDAVLGRVRETVLQAINGGSQVIPTMVLTEALEPRGDGSPTENDELNPPIELPKVNEILEWLMGEYGMRPPTSAEGSSDGSSNLASGTNSTESASREVSISSLSLPTSS
jgi:hypothetical protein